MARIVKDLLHIKERNVNGRVFKEYTTVGSIFIDPETDQAKSISLKTSFNPAGAINEQGECWLSIVDRKKKETHNEPEVQEAQEDKIPF